MREEIGAQIERPVQHDEDFFKEGYETDEGEEFKIISQTKNLEPVSEELSTGAHLDRKRFFKPKDFKNTFNVIATEEIPSDINQDEQFAFVLEKILSVAKEAFLAHTAVFFWYNNKKHRLTLEKFVSSSNGISEQKYPIENDILSKIVLNEEPELLTDITMTAETDVIRYYSSAQGIKSFVGVPLFYGKSLTGILALDSKVSDAFGIETIYSLGRVVRVISIIISLFEDRFKETLAEQRLKSLLGVLSTDKKFSTEEELFNTLEQSVENLITWDAFTFVYYFPAEQKFITAKIVNRTSLKYIGEFLDVELPGTVVGKSILTSAPIKIDDTSSMELPRFSKSENISFDGSFLALPLMYDDQIYGVLCFESLKKNVYSNEDVKFLKNATKIFAFIIYSYSSGSYLRSLLTVDVDTKMLSQKEFRERLSAELVKSKELNVSGSVALVKIDDFIEQDSLFEGDPFPKVLSAISESIKDEMTAINIVGRLKERIFAIYFFNVSAKDVFLWAEKLRIKIARKPISVISKQTTFTVSIGIAATNNKSNADEIIHNAELALKKAVEKGGNSVKSVN
ncbi:MAG: GAF domain-containing protein [bacterium]